MAGNENIDTKAIAAGVKLRLDRRVRQRLKDTRAWQPSKKCRPNQGKYGWDPEPYIGNMQTIRRRSARFL